MTSKKPLVSVIIATYNRPERLARALAGIAAQTIGRENTEAVVINDGGPSVAHIASAHDDSFPIQLVELDKRGGVSNARNVAIDIARGKHIAFLDDDDMFAPDHLASGLVPLESDQADFVYLGAVVSDRWLDDVPPDVSGFPLKAYPWNHQVLQVANYLHTGSVIVRNFQDTPLRFDTQLEVCEDWDLWLALTARYRSAFVDKLTSIYHQVRNFDGLVVEGQMQVPTKFQLTRDYIYAKWSVDDPFVLAYREWMNALERYRSDLVLQGRPLNFNFDDLLKYLYARMARQEMPEPAHISQFFAG